MSYLGIEVSTQSCKAILLDENLNTVGKSFVKFDEDLPKFQTQGGVHKTELGPNSHRVTSPVLMWVAGFELVLERLKATADLSQVKAVSGSGQQHGSVYWKKGALQTLNNLNSDESLESQLNTSFSVQDCPIWMDSSTTSHCQDLEARFGGPEKLAKLVGSVAVERFTVNQITKIFHDDPAAYHRTERISLVSSFITSLFVGRYAAIDDSDASGMNCMNISTRKFDEGILQWAGPDLLEKLGQPEPAFQQAGPISTYMSKRFGIPASCVVINSSGDNPCSLAGLGMKVGDVAVSLGTSDTMWGSLPDPSPQREGFILADPVHSGAYMAMLVYKNGSLTREYVRDKYYSADWDKFNHDLKSSAAGNNNGIGFYYKEVEIIPHAAHGMYKFLDRKQVSEFKSPSTEARAVVESQFLSMLHYSKKIGLSPTRILATGGASNNKDILQVLADVFGVKVYTIDQPDSAPLGAALRAAHGLAKQNTEISFDKVVEKVISHKLVCEPNLSNSYKQIEAQFVQLLETHVLKQSDTQDSKRVKKS